MTVRWRKIAEDTERAELRGIQTKTVLLVEKTDDGRYLESLCRSDDDDYIEIGESDTIEQAKAHLIEEASRLNQEANDKFVKERRQQKKTNGKKKAVRGRTAQAIDKEEAEKLDEEIEELEEAARPKKKRNRKRSRRPRDKKAKKQVPVEESNEEE